MPMRSTNHPANLHARFLAAFEREYTLLQRDLEEIVPHRTGTHDAIMLLLHLMFRYFIQQHGLSDDTLPSLTTRPQTYGKLSTATRARISAFFASYTWNIRDQNAATPGMITPHIMNTLFERYMQQKPLGAYYTSADIASYIGQNTVLPCLMQKMQSDNLVIFQPDSPCWRLLQNDPERYLAGNLCTQAHLPTETSMEYRYRQTRYQELRARLCNGTIHAITDLVTYNLHIHRFLLDLLAQSRGTVLHSTMYKALRQLSILDPTSGSGAFLLAAYTLLEPLYHACIERLQIQTSCNQALFVTKTILQQNLYGVDIMPEAVEVCRMRLLLKLLASVQNSHECRELVDLHLNIHVGNTLLANSQNQQQTLSTSMQRENFDVIVGNPPYIEYSKVKELYEAAEDEVSSCGNLYAAVITRALNLCVPQRGYIGLLVPLSICGAQRFQRLRNMLTQHCAHLWLANFEIFPSRLFDGAFQRLTILLASSSTTPLQTLHTTRLQRWYAVERPHLLDLLSYTRVPYEQRPVVFPKLASPLQNAILARITQSPQGSTIARALQQQRTPFFVYYQEATNYWTKAVCHVPFYKKNGVVKAPTHGRFLYFRDALTARNVMALLNSSLFYLWFATYADGFHLAHSLVKAFPAPYSLLCNQELAHLGVRLEDDIHKNAQLSTRNTRSLANQSTTRHQIELEEYRMSCSKPLLDAIDRALAEHYGFTNEELDFIINYDIKYRLGAYKGKQG